MGQSQFPLVQDDELPKLSEREIKIYKNFWGRLRSVSREFLACILSEFWLLFCCFVAGH